MSRANEEVLDLLHKLVFTGLSEELERAIEASRQPRTITDDDGKEVPNPAYSALNPQLIDKALKALKDNGVDAPAKSERVDSLASKLAALEVDIDDPSVIQRTH